MKIRSEARSDVGRKRKGNEDSLALDEEQQLYVVADGMGGHAAGEVASRVAVEAIVEFVTLTGGNEEITWPFGLDETISYDGNRLKTAIRHANRRVLETTRERSELEGMATTVAAVLVDGDVANIAHVGDSRIYLWSGGEFRLLTSDHSWINEQVQSGVISAEQARSHPLRNVVTRALGGRSELVVDVQSRQMAPGDVLLLCSDGLTTMVPDPDIARILAASNGDLESGAQALVDRRERAGRRRQHHRAPRPLRGVMPCSRSTPSPAPACGSAATRSSAAWDGAAWAPSTGRSTSRSSARSPSRR